MPEDVYFRYLPQFLSIHESVFECVASKLTMVPRQLELSFNQLNIYEYVAEHKENYCYYRYSMSFPEIANAVAMFGSESRMILAINNELSSLKYNLSSDREEIMADLQKGWSAATKTEFRYKNIESVIAEHGMEVLLTVHFWDALNEAQLFKILYFEKTVAPILETIGRWVPRQTKLRKIENYKYS